MIAINISEFRNNIKKYLAMSKEQRVLITAPNNELYELVPHDKISDTERLLAIPEFRERVERGIRQARNGELSELTDRKRKELLGL